MDTSIAYFFAGINKKTEDPAGKEKPLNLG